VRLQDVLIAYNNSVIDVRNITKATVFDAVDRSIIKKADAKFANKTEETSQTTQT
jgi:glycosylphosphatidylinositol transamidase (GPIT) subunit GPI8